MPWVATYSCSMVAVPYTFCNSDVDQAIMPLAPEDGRHLLTTSVPSHIIIPVTCYIPYHVEHKHLSSASACRGFTHFEMQSEAESV